MQLPAVKPTSQLLPTHSVSSPSPQMNLSQLVWNLMTNTGSVPDDSDIQMCSKLSLDLEGLKEVSELLMKSDHLFLLLRNMGINMPLSDSAELSGLWFTSGLSPTGLSELYLSRHDMGEQIVAPELLISVPKLILYRTQKDSKCLSGKDLGNLPLNYLSIGNANLRKTNLSGTHLKNAHLHFINLGSANLKWLSLENAVLENVRLDGAKINAGTNFTNTKITLYLPKQWTPAKLYRLLNTINSINDIYRDLKVNLIHQIIDSLKKTDDKSFARDQNLFSKLIELLKNPIYLQDEKITSFLSDKFFNLNTRVPASKDLLVLLKVIENTDPEARKKIISHSTDFVVQLMTLCSVLCAEGENEIISLSMLHQLVDCLSNVDMALIDTTFLMALLDHPIYINDEKIMLFMAVKLIKRNSTREDFVPSAVSDKQDFLFVQNVVDCLSQKKFIPDNNGPAIQLMALYAQSYSEIDPEFSVNMMLHAIELFRADGVPSCQSVLWNVLLTNPVYLQDAKIVALITSKFISTKIVVGDVPESRSEDELKRQFLLNVIQALSPEDQRKFMLNNNNFFVRFVEWCTRKDAPARIARQAEALYADYLALPELQGAADIINRHNGHLCLPDQKENKPGDVERYFVFCQREGDVSRLLLLSRKEIRNMPLAGESSDLSESVYVQSQIG